MKHLPNALTLCNLWLGMWALWLASEYRWLDIWYVLCLAALCDVADGWLARRLKAHSPLGKDLDSLADVITFGAAPGLAVFHYALKNEFMSTGVYCDVSGCMWAALLPYVRAGWGFLLPLAAAYRLARYNNDPNQSSWFKGLSAPASGLFVVAALNALNQHSFSPLVQRTILIGVSAATAWLMVSNLPLFSLKINWPFPFKFRILFFGLMVCASGALIALVKFDAAGPILVGYLIVSHILKRYTA
ncbi:MAG: CDP-alcohol phosphatidyltransferase family protein [Flavobacteriales bacterium]|nr:CDP-alcohol phosphatidyltransferase family protein [Flavobacteriales bacterium]MCX7649450.1 CDP-alcohol phosphatidyltransferase family protein [Flavobacteriales bacterium]MDW8432560.1 CDP-alcohol phosphatidyltransferase family protein [Flavobacteriales bacterium]